MRQLLLSIFLIQSVILSAQSVRISGTICDINTKETLISTTCYDVCNGIGHASNSMGQFHFDVPVGKEATLTFSHIGYSTLEMNFVPNNDTTLNIYLQIKTNEINEVNISEYASLQKDNVLGKITLPIKTIEALPSFIGIPDLMKAITFLPGISGGKEGFSNIYVRGGDRGQNLILLDGIKLYNTNHVGGFISLINSDILKHVDIYKGGFPARYGGRASSIIDTYTKDGNKEKLKGKISIGVLNSSLILEGSLAKKFTFFVAARSSYLNLLNAFEGEDIDSDISQEEKTYIYDINAKLSWQLSGNQKLALSFINGCDKQKSEITTGDVNETGGLNINTTGISLLHRGKLNNRLYAETLAAYSVYRNNNHSSSTQTLDNGSATNVFEGYSNIEDYSFKSRLDFYQSNVYTMRTGVEASFYKYKPGLQSTSYDNDNTQTYIDDTAGYQQQLVSSEISLYQEHEITVSPKIKLNFGIRAIKYFCEDTSYFRLEPRLSSRFNINNNIALKANYTIMNQFNHVLINNLNGFEREIWFSATKELPPQVAQQGSVGIYYNNPKIQTDISLEAFYKKMSHLQEYQSPLFEDETLDNISNLTAKNGIGKARGFELYIKKDFSRLMVNLNYTLSWSDRQFDDINNGQWYPFIYDRRHDLSIVTIFNMNKQYSFGANFNLTSGAPITLPIGFSGDDGLMYRYFIYDDINNQNLPLYHRLDLMFKNKKTTAKGRSRTWTFNLYNAYAHQNTLYISYNSYTNKTYKLNSFTILPSISYTLNF